MLPILLMFILSAGYVSAADISAKVKEFKVGPEGKWIIAVEFKNNSKNRAITALGYKINFEYDGKKELLIATKIITFS